MASRASRRLRDALLYARARLLCCAAPRSPPPTGPIGPRAARGASWASSPVATHDVYITLRLSAQLTRSLALWTSAHQTLDYFDTLYIHARTSSYLSISGVCSPYSRPMLPPITPGLYSPRPVVDRLRFKSSMARQACWPWCAASSLRLRAGATRKV